ncbi:MAG: hypothetical protein QOD57_2265, partial [Actinomycetota bacterium]|nr:hypothetical protein [Actinomycetota bacterium]
FDPALVRAFMGISLGVLWWTAGVSALLAQIPLLGRVGALPGLARIRSGLAGSATAVATVSALVVAGAVGGGGGGQPAVSRQGVQAAAPAPPSAAPPTSTPPTTAVAAAGETAAVSPVITAIRPRPAGPVRPAPSIDDVLKGVATTVTTAPPSSGPPPAPAPAPTAAPPAPPPAPFTAHGQLLAPDLLGRLGIGLTNRGPAGGCGPSASQGLDAWVFQLPEGEGVPGAGAPVKATGSDLLGLHNLAVTFLSQDCVVTGQLDSPEPDEAGVLPAGTRYVVVSDRSGVGTAVTLTVG